MTVVELCFRVSIVRSRVHCLDSTYPLLRCLHASHSGAQKLNVNAVIRTQLVPRNDFSRHTDYASPHYGDVVNSSKRSVRDGASA